MGRVFSYNEVYDASIEYFKGDELAAKVFTDKYALRDNGNFYERTPDDMHHRLAREFHRIEKNYPCPLSYDEIYEQLEGFSKIIPQGSPMFGIGNPFQLVSLSNCVVIQPPEDSLSSIYQVAKNMSNLFARRCGVGTDLSRLRPQGSPVKNAAKTSTGAWSFANLYSFVCRHTAQEGRRGALMLTMHVSHPDIEKFVTMKQDLSAVTGANVSVLISNDFMRAVEKDLDWNLTFGGRVYRTVKARDLWGLICQCAWNTAEPGILFWDNYKNYMPLNCYKEEGFEIVSTNPCGEIGLSPNDSCRLITLNLKSFVRNRFKPDAYFDFKDFSRTVRIAQRLMDDLVDLEIECLGKICDVSDDPEVITLFRQMQNAARVGRRTGLGTTGLADALAALGLRYDDPGEARNVINKIYRTLRDEAYFSSVVMAQERGAFPIFNWEKEKDCLFFRTMPEDLIKDMRAYGRRNGSLLTNAPNGSTSILAQLDGSGIEPFFSLQYTRRRKINHNDKNSRVDFVDEQGDAWEHFTVHNRCVREYLNVNGLPDNAPLPDYFVTSADIDKMARVDVQAAITSYIDHGTSSTINVPSETTPEEIAAIYERAAKMGLKGVTVYRDGCRSGVLVKTGSNQKDLDWYKRPVSLECDIYHETVKHGQDFLKFIIIVGLRDGTPYEVFGGPAGELDIPRACKRGWITKHKGKKRNRYSLHVEGDGVIHNLGELLVDGPYSTINRLCSFGLRNRGGVNYLVDQLTKEKDSDIYTYTKVLARVLKSYITSGSQSSIKCESCGSKTLIYAEGCVMCTSCGASRC